MKSTTRFMIKTIDTLIEDIYALFGSGREFNEVLAKKYGELMAEAVTQNVPRLDAGGTLRGSNLGKPCMREKWYTVNKYERHEGFTPATKMKFLYGHILEEVLLYLAAEAGHSVEGQQDTLDIGPVKGHRDAVIDGVLVDVKSAVPFSFMKFKNHLTEDNDGFGYIGQLQSYLWASQDDPLLIEKNKAAFFVIDKMSGEMCLDFHEKDGKDWGVIAERQQAVVDEELPPERAFPAKPEGASGNMKLGVNCSYCAFKRTCWPGMRTFLYSGNKQTHLVDVQRPPKVPEVTYSDT